MTHLKFDSSGSAMVRIFGKPVLVDIHWAERTPMTKLACVCGSKYSCKGCAEGMPKTQKAAIFVWDISEERFSAWIASLEVLMDAFSKMQKFGVSKDDMESGQGADVLVQRMPKGYEVEIMRETIGQKRGDAPPNPNELPSSIHRLSVWRQ